MTMQNNDDVTVIRWWLWRYGRDDDDDDDDEEEEEEEDDDEEEEEEDEDEDEDDDDDDDDDHDHDDCKDMDQTMLILIWRWLCGYVDDDQDPVPCKNQWKGPTTATSVQRSISSISMNLANLAISSLSSRILKLSYSTSMVCCFSTRKGTYDKVRLLENLLATDAHGRKGWLNKWCSHWTCQTWFPPVKYCILDSSWLHDMSYHFHITLISF